MLSYDGRKIIPSPIVALSKTYINTQDGSKIGAGYEITLTGTLLPFMGSPSGHYNNLDQAFWQLTGYPPDEQYESNNEDFNHILRKQEALRYLFSVDGKSLEWQADYGQPVVKCNPRIISIDFTPGSWADRCDYTIKAQADFIYINGTLIIEDLNIGSGFIKQAQDQWEFAEIEGRNGQGYEVSRSISANGIKGYDELGLPFGGKEAWEHAKLWVDNRSSGVVDPSLMFQITGSSGWIGGAYSRSPNIDKAGGSYSLVEKWTIQPSNTYSELNFSIQYNESEDEYVVNYQNTIYGLENGHRKGSPSALNNAKAAIPNNAAIKASILANLTSLLDGRNLSDSPNSINIALSPKDGTATVTADWSTSDNSSYTVRYTASASFAQDSNTYSITLTEEIVGKGANRDIRLLNAKLGILSDADALAKALSILETQIPPGITIGSSKRSKTTSINERQASINCSWTWDNNSSDNLGVTVVDNYPSEVTAIIPIPGKATGPVIQDMQTVTEHTIVVTLRSQGHTSRPNAAEQRSLADSYAGIVAGNYYVIGDNETWSPTTRTYQREIKYLIKT